MNFQDLKSVENYQFYLDVALKKAEEKADLLRQSIKLKSVSREIKSTRIEIDKLKIIKQEICSRLNKIYMGFPNIDNLPEFYNQLLLITLDVDKLKNSLGSVSWAEKKIKLIVTKTIIKLKTTNNLGQITKLGSMALGRIASILKQIDKHFTFIEESRKKMKSLPSIKTSMFTIAIAGFPNVGKSTLLSQITSADPKIKNYAFTTLKLNVGYKREGIKKYQFIDTPGTLARFEKMNHVEKLADLAMKYAADMIVYIFDLSETYPLDDQKRLFEKLLIFEKPILIYLSKTDIVKQDVIDNFINNFDSQHKIFSNKEKLVAEIIKQETKEQEGY